MKLQIEGQKLRVRIDEDELARLLAGDGVESQTHFATAFAIHCTLRTTTGDRASFAGQASCWEITLPARDVQAHAARLPARDGLRYSIANGDAGKALELLFDVDVRDSVKRRRSP